MLCENCKALSSYGGEDCELYCPIVPEEEMTEFDEGCGCRLSPSVIKRKFEKNERDYEKHCIAMAQAYCIDQIETSEEKSLYLETMKECIGAYAYNFPKVKRRCVSPFVNRLKVNLNSDEYHRCWYLLNCGFMESDMTEERQRELLFREPRPDETSDFWLTKEGFRWLSQKEGITYHYLSGPVVYLNTEDRLQVEAYGKREKIKVGDRFVWKRNGNYITSGRNRKKCMYSPDFPYEKEGPLEVYKLYEGRNGYGPFVDYWLKIPGKDESEYRIIINAIDAMKMKRCSQPS